MKAIASSLVLCLIALPALSTRSFGEESVPPEADRAAILAMAGEFEVTFDFSETVSLQPGYKLTKPYGEDATEMVIVIEDTGDRIALQHILSVGKDRIVKHWKQIWTWEDRFITEYQGGNQWQVREISEAEAKGTWSQLVTQVDDSPRYESFAAWNHDGGYSRWESPPTNRPLPRREYSKRDDYDILLGTNRHALTPLGWVHGQDNLKMVLAADGSVDRYLAREEGINVYNHAEDADFTRAREYWTNTSDFWALVSAFWTEKETKPDTFSMGDSPGDVSMVMALFKEAKKIDEGTSEIPAPSEIADLILPFIED